MKTTINIPVTDFGAGNACIRLFNKARVSIATGIYWIGDKADVTSDEDRAKKVRAKAQKLAAGHQRAIDRGQQALSNVQVEHQETVGYEL